MRPAMAESSTTGEAATTSVPWFSPTPITVSPARSAASACSMMSRRRWRLSGRVPVTGSGTTSPSEKMPISKFMAHLGVHGVCPRTGVPVPEPAPEARPGRPV